MPTPQKVRDYPRQTAYKSGRQRAAKAIGVPRRKLDERRLGQLIGVGQEFHYLLTSERVETLNAVRRFNRLRPEVVAIRLATTNKTTITPRQTL